MLRDERRSCRSQTSSSTAIHRRLATRGAAQADLDEREMRREPFSMPFSVSGELCMDRKAVRHALIMALETFTIDDKIYLSWSKSLLQSTSLFYRCCLEPAAARSVVLQ